MSTDHTQPSSGDQPWAASPPPADAPAAPYAAPEPYAAPYAAPYGGQPPAPYAAPYGGQPPAPAPYPVPYGGQPPAPAPYPAPYGGQPQAAAPQHAGNPYGAPQAADDLSAYPVTSPAAAGPQRFLSQQSAEGQAYGVNPSQHHGAYAWGAAADGDPFGTPGGPALSSQQYAAYGAGGYQTPVYLPPFASWGARVGASVIDGLIASGPLMLVYGIMIAVMVDNPQNEAAIIPLSMGMMLAGLWSTGWWLFDRVFRQGRTGQSVGKRALGIRLIDATMGTPPGGGLTFGREFAHLLDSYSLYIGYLWPLWDDKSQTFADKVCHTVVVRH